MGIVHGIGGLIILFERLGRAVDAVTLHAAQVHSPASSSSTTMRSPSACTPRATWCRATDR
jgi:hypothetical protein